MVDAIEDSPAQQSLASRRAPPVRALLSYGHGNRRSDSQSSDDDTTDDSSDHDEPKRGRRQPEAPITSGVSPTVAMLSMLLIAAIALAVSFGMRNFSLGDDGKVSVSTSKGEAGAGTAANAPGTVTQTVTSVSTLASEEAASSKVDRPSQSAGSSPSQPAATGSGSTSGGASSGEADAFVKTILDGHNDSRRKHDAADLVWNTTLQASAQKWAEHCVWEHSGGKVGPYGENLSAVVPFQKNDKFDPMSGISVWNGEEKDYDYSKPTGFTHETGHFTQVVWIGTQQIGCAFTTCEGFFGHPLGAFFVCEYWPGGNIVTDDLKYFKDNVKPP